MSGQRLNLLKLVALNTVLDRLSEQIGSEAIQVLKSALFHGLSTKVITNTDSLVSVELWHKNLKKVIGKEAADMIMQDFYLELDRISAKITARPAVVTF
jgi:hypothetical protein